MNLLNMEKLAIICIVIVQLLSAKELPANFQLCHKSDPDVGECIARGIQGALVLLKNGLPSLNMPAIEPMKINTIEVAQAGGTTTFNLNSSFKNSEIHGLATSKIKRTGAKFKKFAMRSETFTNRLDYIGDYTMNGQILVLPIRGAGFANVSMQGLTSRHDMRGEYFTGSDNQTYINVTSYKIKFKPKAVTFRFDNLFNDRVLSDTMNRFMNENWEAVFNGIIPGYEDAFGEKFKAVANILFHQVPAKAIFLE